MNEHMTSMHASHGDSQHGGFHPTGNTLLFEIGTEEIPAAFIPGALDAIKTRFSEQVEKWGLSLGNVRTLGTPRRLVLVAEGLPLSRPFVQKTVMGPAKKAAYDAEGNLTKAALGFAKAQGVEPAALFVEETAKGPYIAALKSEGGEQVRPLLEAFLPELVRAIPFKKSMRWANFEQRFARPIHWFVASFAGELVPFEVDGIHSGQTSTGMRFFGPRHFAAPDVGMYLAGCKAAYIMVDPAQRREKILRELHTAAAELGGEVDLDAHLLNEATWLTECPRVIIGSFEKRYLAMPAQVPVTVMKHHQRYFPVYQKAEGQKAAEDQPRQLLPYFLAVINTPADELSQIIHGNERVMRARLSDGEFFWHEDLKTPLADRIEKLGGIIFHARLGTSKAKVERMVALSGWLAEHVLHATAPQRALVERAALLAKADLVTRMVGEFPELQGTMGGIYARKSGEEEAVARAIEEHYLPVGAGGALPATDIGAVVSIADKLDSLVGFIGVGLSPSAAADPFALRRQTLGILNILLERGWDIPLSALIQQAFVGLTGVVKRPEVDVIPEVLEFVKTRLRGLLTADGAPTDLVDAVISAGFERVPDVSSRLKALRALSQAGDFAPLMVAFKRAANITRDQADAGEAALVDLLPVEQALVSATQTVTAGFHADLARGDYERAMVRLLELKAPIDDFFTGVMVMDADPTLRARRLAILHRISALFKGVADLSRISTDI